MSKNPQGGRSVRRGDYERLACHFDRPRLTAVHGAPGLCCPPLHRNRRTRATSSALHLSHDRQRLEEDPGGMDLA